VSVYQCGARVPCGESREHCTNLPPSGVGRRYCDGLQRCGIAPEGCASPDTLDTNLFNWQREAVNAEVLRCLDLSCTAVQKCLDAYFAVLTVE